jgi:hypothetical protein
LPGVSISHDALQKPLGYRAENSILRLDGSCQVANGKLQEKFKLLLLIIRNCDSPRDLIALISTCRRIYDVWRVTPAAAIWPACLHELPHFQDAITAVSTRATNLQKSHSRIRWEGNMK